MLARLFYSPPKTLEELIKALGCSLIDEDPQIALAALGSRSATDCCPWIEGPCSAPQTPPPCLLDRLRLVFRIQHLDPKLPRLALPAIFNELDVRWVSSPACLCCSAPL